MRTLVIILVVGVTPLVVVWGRTLAEGELSVRDNRSAGQYCGPCCVRYILKVLGQTHDLDELIREIQPPDLQGGATLDSLSQALAHRGVHTLPVVLKHESDVELIFPYPIILHLNPRSGKDAHYVVWLPSLSSDTTMIWDPLVGRIMETTWAAYRPQLSGAILLTSPHPMASPHFAIRRRMDDQLIWTSASLTLTALLLVSACLAVQYGPRRSRSKAT